jgi:hypothetical protein
MNRAQESRPYVKITVNGQTLCWDPNSNPLIDHAECRRVTGLPLSAFLSTSEDAIGGDTLLVWWWAARRVNGEPKLPLSAVFREFDTPDKLEEALEVVEIVSEDEEDAEVRPLDEGETSSTSSPS